MGNGPRKQQKTSERLDGLRARHEDLFNLRGVFEVDVQSSIVGWSSPRIVRWS